MSTTILFLLWQNSTLTETSRRAQWEADALDRKARMAAAKEKKNQEWEDRMNLEIKRKRRAIDRERRRVQKIFNEKKRLEDEAAELLRREEEEILRLITLEQSQMLSRNVIRIVYQKATYKVLQRRIRRRQEREKQERLRREEEYQRLRGKSAGTIQRLYRGYRARAAIFKLREHLK